jgi:hypothetical protein
LLTVIFTDSNPTTLGWRYKSEDSTSRVWAFEDEYEFQKHSELCLKQAKGEDVIFIVPDNPTIAKEIASKADKVVRHTGSEMATESSVEGGNNGVSVS